MGLGSITQQRWLPDPIDEHISVKLNITKKLTHGLGDPSDGLHDPPLERINWNAAPSSTSKPENLISSFVGTKIIVYKR